MIDIKLKDNETGYNIVSKYIETYWNKNDYRADIIVHIATSYDGIKYDDLKELAFYNGYAYNVEFLNDWWEGEKFIKIFGLKYVEAVDNFDEI